MSYIGYEQLGKLNFNFEAIKDAFDGDLLENAAKQGSLFIELGVTTPTLSASGVEASIGAEGYNNESPPKFYKKVGENDTDWEQILTSTGGEFVANIELADATDQVLVNNVLGQVNGRLAVGDGVTTGGNQFVIKHNDGEKFALGNWNWTFADGVGVLDTAPDVSATALNIPAVWFPQTIDDDLFNGDSAWTSLVIPNSVTSIGSGAFYECDGLTGNLTIPDSVTSIGSNAFYNCYSLDGNLSIGNSVTSIGSRAFYGCETFTGDLTIPDSVTTIGSYAFNNCTGFNGALTIGNSVTTIGSYAFYNCSGLIGNLTIPDSVITIEGNAFSNCLSLTGNLIIPNSVTTIGKSAFYFCNFTDVTIPNSVTSLGQTVFRSSANLTNINCYITKTIIDAATNCFQNSGITTLHARSDDDTWSEGAGQTIGGKTGITVTKDL
jgi:hypothetical protein